MLSLSRLSLQRTTLISRSSYRPIFTLPDFSNLSPFADRVKIYNERKVLPYRPEELYNVVADVASYPQFVPFCSGSRIIVAPAQNARGQTVLEAELTVGFLSFKESYVSAVTCTPHRSVEVVASSATPLFKTLRTTWSFQNVPALSPHVSTCGLRPGGAGGETEGDGSTLVMLDLAYAFANPLHASMSAAFFEKVSKRMIKAFEDRCSRVYARGP